MAHADEGARGEGRGELDRDLGGEEGGLVVAALDEAARVERDRDDEIGGEPREARGAASEVAEGRAEVGAILVLEPAQGDRQGAAEGSDGEDGGEVRRGAVDRARLGLGWRHDGGSAGRAEDDAGADASVAGRARRWAKRSANGGEEHPEESEGEGEHGAHANPSTPGWDKLRLCRTRIDIFLEGRARIASLWRRTCCSTPRGIRACFRRPWSTTGGPREPARPGARALTTRDEWRWTDDRGVQRLVGTEELRAALTSALLPGTTLVWREGMKEWKTAAAMPELADAVAQAPKGQTAPGRASLVGVLEALAQEEANGASPPRPR